MAGMTILLIGSGELAGDALKGVQRRDRSILVENRCPGGTPASVPGGCDFVFVEAPAGRAEESLARVRGLRTLRPSLPIVFVAADSTEDLAIRALRAGASDYLRLPVSPGDLNICLDRFVPNRPPSSTPGSARPGAPDPRTSRLVGDGPAMCKVRELIVAVAPTDSCVLVTGDTGTGKELVAELIHAFSARRGRPFIRINCAALPDSLLESELFGHERGAFTGAQFARDGLLRSGDGGTVVLDEIGDMSPGGQAKILRVVESKEIYRIGARGRIALDVRFLASTNQDLDRCVAERRFRPDLYYRLNVARLHLPALRDRMEDLPSLLTHYIEEFNLRFGRQVEGFTEEALERLLHYPWPGNVREVRNLVEATFIGLPPRRIALVDLPEHFRRRMVEVQDLPAGERERLLAALFSADWNKSRAARALRWSRMTLYRKMKRYQVIPIRA